jgi:hypothetical protein
MHRETAFRFMPTEIDVVVDARVDRISIPVQQDAPNQWRIGGGWQLLSRQSARSLTLEAGTTSISLTPASEHEKQRLDQLAAKQPGPNRICALASECCDAVDPELELLIGACSGTRRDLFLLRPSTEQCSTALSEVGAWYAGHQRTAPSVCMAPTAQ